MEGRDLFKVVERWEITGLLEGLPMANKIGLATLYDDITRMLLNSDLSESELDKLTTFSLMAIKKLYKRVGDNFDLVTFYEKAKIYLIGNPKPIDKDNILEFINTYEDDVISKSKLSDEEYSYRINSVVRAINDILLEKNPVSHISDDGFKYADIEMNNQQLRYWNRRKAIELFTTLLSQID